ncbi:GtrA family protein [Shimia sediminis]|uniref:GtrA family protein n=1 Tax=Shimia sediminis TaxID=2497945 RepID=UPI0013DF8EBF|nr:GtrA family protein [Shimia sediminis]
MHRLADFAQIFRFAGVGVTCSVMYFLLASAFHSFAGLAAISASFVAYALSAVFGYHAHRRFTFASNSAISGEALRFFMVTVLGLTISIAVPWVLGNYTPALSFMTVLLIVPSCSFLMMKFFVFRP